MRGDCPYYVATAYSIAYDHDLEISNQLGGPDSFTRGQVAIDVNGRIVPKHPIWMALASIPWFVVIGPQGGLWFNVAHLGLLLVLLWVLTRRIAEEPAASLAVALTGVFTFLPHYVWNFSPDVFTTTLIVAGLVLISNTRAGSISMFLAGVVFAIAVTARPTFAVMVVPVGLLLPSWRPKVLLPLALGFLLPTTAWMTLNTHLFGGPLTTAYDRILIVVDGEATLYSHRADFDYPIFKGARGQLLDSEKGLLWTSPITLLALFGFANLWRRHRAFAIYTLVSGLGLFVVFSAYQAWMMSHAGNRFLMPVVVLGCLPLASLVDWLLNRRRSRHP